MQQQYASISSEKNSEVEAYPVYFLPSKMANLIRFSTRNVSLFFRIILLLPFVKLIFLPIQTNANHISDLFVIFLYLLK